MQKNIRDQRLFKSKGESTHFQALKQAKEREERHSLSQKYWAQQQAAREPETGVKCRSSPFFLSIPGWACLHLTLPPPFQPGPSSGIFFLQIFGHNWKWSRNNSLNSCSKRASVHYWKGKIRGIIWDLLVVALKVPLCKPQTASISKWIGGQLRKKHLRLCVNIVTLVLWENLLNTALMRLLKAQATNPQNRVLDATLAWLMYKNIDFLFSVWWAWQRYQWHERNGSKSAKGNLILQISLTNRD